MIKFISKNNFLPLIYRVIFNFKCMENKYLRHLNSKSHIYEFHWAKKIIFLLIKSPHFNFNLCDLSEKYKHVRNSLTQNVQL